MHSVCLSIGYGYSWTIVHLATSTYAYEDVAKFSMGEEKNRNRVVLTKTES